MREDIKKIYMADTWTYDCVMGFTFNESDENRKYYVYEWHTNDGKIFYIGKGTGNRYKHILREIELFENNPKKYKGKTYKILKDSYGIDYSIMMSALTECEALIMENYYIIEQLKKRQPLLNNIIPCLPEDIEEWWFDLRCNGNILEYFR